MAKPAKTNSSSEPASQYHGWLHSPSFIKRALAVWGYNKIVGTIVFGLFLFVILFFIILAAIIGGGGESLGGNVALIPIKGVIVGDEVSGLFEEGAASEEIVELIEQAAENPSIKAIILEINTPGGSAVASDEIAQALKKTDKTTVAWIREIGTSGGYWIASATDHIVANRMSITGSIGVTASSLDFSGFISRYNISYERRVSGKYKDIGTPFREPTQEERVLFQKAIDGLHGEFVDEVAENRGMERKEVARLATGMFYIGSEALDLGLVDELGGKQEAIAFIEEKEGITAELVDYEPEVGLLDILAGALSEQSFHVGQGIGDAMLEKGKSSTLEITT